MIRSAPQARHRLTALRPELQYSLPLRGWFCFAQPTTWSVAR